MKENKMTKFQYPLMIAGVGNTHKTTIALDIAYREYLSSREKYGKTKCCILVLSTDMFDVGNVFNIFSSNILDSSMDVYSELADKNIEIKLNGSIDFLIEQDPNTVKFLIIDDLYVFIESRSPSYGITGISERMNRVVSECKDHGIKLITVAYLQRMLKSADYVPMIRDHGTRHLFNRFIFTSEFNKDTKISTRNDITVYTKDTLKENK